MSRHVLTAMIVLLLVSAAGAKPITATSHIEAVTLYRGQALVTRAVALPQDKGDLEIVVPDLPARVIGSSLSASAADGVAIRSVRFRSRAVAAAPSKEVADVEAAIKDIQREIYANTQKTATLTAKSKYVDKLETFATSMTKIEMAKGALNVKTLTDMTTHVFDTRTHLTEERIKLNEQERELKERLALLQRKHRELVSKSGKALREAVIFVSKTNAQAGAIHLRYLVDSATWSPAYNIRLNDDGGKADVEYLAHVNQASGEDWANVAMTLSTATPAMNARGPLLVPYWITLQGGPAQAMSSGLYYLSRAGNVAFQHEVLQRWQAGKDLDKANWDLNRLAGEAQEMELNVQKDLVKVGNIAVRSVQEGLAVSYPLAGKMNLASRPDQQLIQITRMLLPAETCYQAVPLLSSYVYRAAEVRNTSDLPLLAGPYSSYVGSEFVGRGRLRLVARGQTATVGFGVDTQLRCRRELVEKDDRVSWGSRIQTFRYRLRLENYKQTPVNVRLLERIPASKTDDLAVTLTRTSLELSTDGLYVRDDRPRGILRWDMQLPADASGAKATDVVYTFQMKYAKDKHIGVRVKQMEKRMREASMDMMLKM